MAEPRTYCNPLFIGKDELIGDTPKASIKGSDTPIPIPAISKTSTPTPTPAFAFVLGLVGRYMNEDLQRAIKLALELFV